MDCIYCEKEINKKSKEHIIQSALGSNLKSVNLLCEDCNNYFARNESGKIDDVFVEQFKEFRNILNIWGDRKTPPPTLRNVSIVDGVPLHLAPGGHPIFAKSIREEEISPDGKLTIKVQSPNIVKAKEQITHMKKQYENSGMTIEDASLNKLYVMQHLKFSTKLGGELVSKGVLKNLYGFLFYLMRDKLISLQLKPIDFTALRNYLRYKVATDEVKANIDYTNELPFVLDSKDVSNYIFIFGSKSSEIIWGFLVVLGHFQYSGILNKNYIGEDFGFGIKQNPENRVLNFFDNVAPISYNSDVTMNYPKYAKNYFKIMETKVSEIINYYFEKSNDGNISNITSEAINSVLKEGDIITKGKINQFARIVAENFTNYQFKIPSSQNIDEDELL